MGLSINIELSDNDLDHFQEILKRAHETAGSKSSKEITDAATALLVDAHASHAPEFITERLAKLDALISMVHDTAWGMPDEDRTRVLTALTYFADPKDVIPPTGWKIVARNCRTACAAAATATVTAVPRVSGCSSSAEQRGPNREKGSFGCLFHFCGTTCSVALEHRRQIDVTQ